MPEPGLVAGRASALSTGPSAKSTHRRSSCAFEMKNMAASIPIVAMRTARARLASPTRPDRVEAFCRDPARAHARQRHQREGREPDDPGLREELEVRVVNDLGLLADERDVREAPGPQDEPGFLHAEVPEADAVERMALEDPPCDRPEVVPPTSPAAERRQPMQRVGPRVEPDRDGGGAGQHEDEDLPPLLLEQDECREDRERQREEPAA